MLKKLSFLLVYFQTFISFSQHIQLESLPFASKVYFLKTIQNNVYGIQANKIKTGNTVAWQVQLISHNNSEWKTESSITLNETGNTFVIKDLAQVQNNIYVAGILGDSNNYFSVIKYNLITKTWSQPFQKLENGQINALASYQNSLFIAGSFLKFNKTIAFNMVLYNQVKDSFYTFGNGFLKGTNGPISHVTNLNDSFVISGRFSKIGDSIRNNIALITLQNKKTYPLQNDTTVITGLQKLQSSIFVSKVKNGIHSFENLFTGKKIEKLTSDSFFILRNIVNNEKWIIWHVLQRKGNVFYLFKNDSIFPLKDQSSFQLSNFIASNGKQIILVGDKLNPTNQSVSFSGIVYFLKRSVSAFVFWDKNKNNQFNKGVDLPLKGIGIKKRFSRTSIFTSSFGKIQWIDEFQNSILDFEIENYKGLKPTNPIFKVNLDTITSTEIYIPIQFNIDSIEDYSIKIILPSGNVRTKNAKNTALLLVSNEGEKSKLISFKLKINEKLSFLKASITPKSSIANTLIWENIFIPFGETKIISIETIAPDTSLKINSNVSFEAILSTPDNFSENNFDTDFQSIALTESFSDIKIQKTKHGKTENNVNINKNDSYLDYQIRAVNSGNDSIHTLIIEDTISIPLPVSQIQLLACTHSFTYSVATIDNNTKLALRYFFSDIDLIPNPTKDNELANSAANLLLRVHFDSTIPINYEFTNTAYITKNNQTKIATNTVIAKVGVSSTYKTNKQIPILVYPNPFINEFNIALNLPFKGSIYTITGKKIYDFNTQIVNISNIPSGSYVLKLFKEHSIYTQKVIKL